MSDWWGAYVGIPYGRGPGELECWGLVARVLAEQCGLDLPAYGETSAAYLGALAAWRAGEGSSETMAAARARMEAEIDAGRAAECWRVVEAPRAFDVAVMCRPSRGALARPGHCGVMIDGARVLHTLPATGAAVAPIGHPAVPRLIEYRRHVSL
ncbi:hypothetical protein [Vannielia litorea]|uniref:hypothetical protein n=1 Tax=Vannielia litorea TaxID=1217970 RepID=UPI001BCE85CE|nr:hypothetical protein [Vannielia litorea]MBS8228403.1 hypothetical protein [Vannielia litorea]